jgi:large subunit ribosomal protein L15
MIDLPKVVKRRNKRVGRGHGSGKGAHTSGRGQKGQKSRRKVHVLFEGYKVKKSLLRRLPLQRGKGKFKASTKPVVVSLEVLNLLPVGTTVNVDSLVKAHIVKESDAKEYGVKILGGGKLTKKLIIALPISKSAASQVTEVGGKIS